VADLPDNERELATPTSTDFMRQLLPSPLEETPPERWVALNAHTIVLGTVFTYRYPDPELDGYVRRVEELLDDWRGSEALRREWLTSEEYDQVLREEHQVRESLE
jgi:hypothetical protein